MKKLFKNLMLVAVAAMAFVACSQEGIEVNNLTKKTIVEGIASINTDDTRSGFVGSETVENEDGTTTTVYKSAWDGDENIKVFATEQGLETTATINADGKFTAEFDGELPANYFIAVCSPAEAWVSAYTCNIPTVQTPRTDSVDPAAHILSQQSIYVSNGSADPFLMQHQVGYGKMTINTPAEFVIDYVEVEFNGVWYGSAKTLNYTINADNVEDNVFWFATDVVEVSDFTVTAYDAEGNAYTKSVTIPEGRELNFKYGRVSKFSVSDLEPTGAVVAPDLSKADYIATDIAWNADSSRFDFTLDGISKTFAVYLNSANTNARHSTILEGDYTVDATKTPAEGKFAVLQNVNGITRSAGDTGVASTMSVKYVNEQYYITIDYNYSDSFGTTEEFTVAYYGIPTNWLAPGEELAEPTKLATPVVTVVDVVNNQATLSWDAISGAGSYTVTYNSETTTVNTNKVDLSNLAWDTTYTVTVVANPADETLNYASDASTPVNVEVGSDPNAGGGETPDTPDVPDGYIEISRCVYYGDLMGAGIRDEFVLTNSDGSTMVFFHTSNTNSDSNRISSGEYTKGGLTAVGYTFSFDSISGSCKINGSNITSITDATMSVKSDGAGANHEIKMTIVANGTTYNLYFNGTIG